MNSPCRYCANRKENCHSTCPDYIAFQEERQAVYKQRQLEIATYNPHDKCYLASQGLLKRRK